MIRHSQNHWQTFLSGFVASVWILVGAGIQALLGQSPTAVDGNVTIESVRQSAYESMLRLENYASVKLVASVLRVGQSDHGMRITLQARGDLVWQEGEEIADKERQAELLALREVSKCKLPVISTFDGKVSSVFNPILLTMMVNPSKDLVGGRDKMLLPDRWLSQGGLNLIHSTKSKSGELGGDRLDDGRWRLTCKNIGSDLDPAMQKYVGFREQFVIVDPTYGFLPTEWGGQGGVLGKLEGTLEWANIGGRWYVTHCKQFFDGQTVREWTIDEISFDAKNCRERFDNLEEIVPFGTKISTYDAANTVQAVRYKGGEAGKEEHALINLARIKVKAERQP